MAARLARDCFIQHPSPPSQAAPFRFEVARLIRNIVDQPHERIERKERISFVARQPKKREIETAVRSSRNPVALSVRIANCDRDAFCRI